MSVECIFLFVFIFFVKKGETNKKKIFKTNCENLCIVFEESKELSFERVLHVFCIFLNRWKIQNWSAYQYDMNGTNSCLIFFSRPVPDTDEEKQLLSKYCLPEADKFRLSEHLMQPPTKESYRIWMHEMLYIEEWAQMDHISR